MKEISLHILDIVQNSVSAGASTVHIAVEEDSILDLISVKITDDGRGMDSETVLRVTDPFYTTRTTRKVGLGLPLMKSTAIDCGGSFAIDSAPGQGTIVNASWRRSHIDTPPLGDMVATMLTILLGDETVDFLYKHSIDDRVFEFESREMKEALDGMSFQEIEVYDWLKSFLGEGEANINAAN